MNFIMNAWRGKTQLSLVFWGYYLGFQIAFVIFFVTVVPLLPKPSSGLAATVTTLTFSLFVLSYIVWIYVSIWRSAGSSKPVYKIIARIFVIMAVIGTAGRMAATGIESYSKYSKLSSEPKSHANMAQSIPAGWEQGELTENYMRSMNKDMCVIKTALSFDKCSTKQCITTLAGIYGDCVTYAKGTITEFCKNYHSKHLANYCIGTNGNNLKCMFFKIGTKTFCQRK